MTDPQNKQQHSCQIDKEQRERNINIALRIARCKAKEAYHFDLIDQAERILWSSLEGVKKSYSLGLEKALARAGWIDIKAYLEEIEKIHAGNPVVSKPDA